MCKTITNLINGGMSVMTIDRYYVSGTKSIMGVERTDGFLVAGLNGAENKCDELRLNGYKSVGHFKVTPEQAQVFVELKKKERYENRLDKREEE